MKNVQAFTLENQYCGSKCFTTESDLTGLDLDNKGEQSSANHPYGEYDMQREIVSQMCENLGSFSAQIKQTSQHKSDNLKKSGLHKSKYPPTPKKKTTSIHSNKNIESPMVAESPSQHLPSQFLRIEHSSQDQNKQIDMFGNKQICFSSYETNGVQSELRSSHKRESTLFQKKHHMEMEEGFEDERQMLKLLTPDQISLEDKTDQDAEDTSLVYSTAEKNLTKSASRKMDQSPVSGVESEDQKTERTVYTKARSASGNEILQSKYVQPKEGKHGLDSGCMKNLDSEGMFDGEELFESVVNTVPIGRYDDQNSPCLTDQLDMGLLDSSMEIEPQSNCELNQRVPEGYALVKIDSLKDFIEEISKLVTQKCQNLEKTSKKLLNMEKKDKDTWERLIMLLNFLMKQNTKCKFKLKDLITQVEIFNIGKDINMQSVDISRLFHIDQDFYHNDLNYQNQVRSSIENFKMMSSTKNVSTGTGRNGLLRLKKGTFKEENTIKEKDAELESSSFKAGKDKTGNLLRLQQFQEGVNDQMACVDSKLDNFDQKLAQLNKELKSALIKVDIRKCQTKKVNQLVKQIKNGTNSATIQTIFNRIQSRDSVSAITEEELKFVEKLTGINLEQVGEQNENALSYEQALDYLNSLKELSGAKNKSKKSSKKKIFNLIAKKIKPQMDQVSSRIMDISKHLTNFKLSPKLQAIEGNDFKSLLDILCTRVDRIWFTMFKCMAGFVIDAKKYDLVTSRVSDVVTMNSLLIAIQIMSKVQEFNMLKELNKPREVIEQDFGFSCSKQLARTPSNLRKL